MIKIIRKNRKAFSLAEAMIATVILSVAATGILLPYTSGAAARAEGTDRTRATMLATDLMEKIINTPFDLLITNYGSYVEYTGGIQDHYGQILTSPRYAEFSRTATCQYTRMSQENGSDSPKFILATVRVYNHGREIATVKRLLTE